MKIHEITPKDYTDLHRLYCQLEDDWTSDIHDMIRVLEEVKDDPHYHLVGIFDDADKLAGTITLSKCLDLTAKARFYYSLENLVIDENYRHQGYGQALMQYVEDYVRRHNGRYVNLTSAVHRTDAHEFYYRIGFPRNYTIGFKKTWWTIDHRSATFCVYYLYCNKYFGCSLEASAAASMGTSAAARMDAAST